MDIEPIELGGAKVLVTGSSSGIGAGLAVALARRGAVVGICGRRPDRLADVLAQCQEVSPECRSWVVDLADHEAVADFAARAEAELGSIDLLVNNAGVPKRRLVARLTPDEVVGVMNVNYIAAALLTLALLPGMLARRRGRILNVASTASRLGGAGEAAYGASKAALATFTEGMAAELGPLGIGVQLVIPGPIDTEIVDYPGEDPPLAARAGIPRLPLEEAVEAIVGHIQSSDFELWLPGYFRDVFLQKAQDPERSISQAGAWLNAHTSD